MPQNPAQIEELPWKPVIAALAGYALGPMAAALVCFANLKRLGAPAKGRKIVLLTAVACLGLMLLVREVPDSYILYVIGHLVVPLLFPFLQRKEFAAWKAAHLEEPASGWTAVWWGLAGLLLLFGVAGVAMFAFPEQVENIAVRVTLPKSVPVGEPFEMKLEVRNTGDREQILRSVVVPWELILRFDGLRSEPKLWKDAPAATGGKYIYRLPIAANGVAELKFAGTARNAGEVSADLKVCIRTDSNCVARRIRTKIVAGGKVP
jgi:hypothetical protein